MRCPSFLHLLFDKPLGKRSKLEIRRSQYQQVFS